MPTYSLNVINTTTADDVVVALPGSGGIDVTLPVPQIAKRAIPLGINPNPNPKAPETGRGWRFEIDGITPRRYNIDDLSLVEYPDGYYKEQFDIYFNSFGDREWLNLPDKRLELCMVRNGKKKSKKITLTTTLLDESYRGNKKRYTNAIVHPANTSVTNLNISNTIYSGGYSENPMQTEWKLNENDLMFTQDGIDQSGLNRLNNPNITIELDIRNFFRNRTLSSTEYPIDMSNAIIAVKGLGIITSTTINQIYMGTSNNFTNGEPAFHKRNPTLFFRLSAGDPKTAKLGSSAKYVFDFNSTIATEGQTVNIDLGYGNTIDNLVVGPGNFIDQFHQVVNDAYSNKYRCKFLTKTSSSGILIEKLVNSNNLYEPDPFAPTITNVDTEIITTPFQTRAADPATFYQKRLFSDLSQPVKIKLKIDNFFVDYDDPTSGYTPFTYGHKTTIG